MPRLLKTGVTLALSCAALAHAPQTAQAQTKQAPLLGFGVPMAGPAPFSDRQIPDVCWAPGTSAATIAAYERNHTTAAPIGSGQSSIEVSPFRSLGQGRWTNTATNGGGLTQGQPTTLTYSIIPDGTAIPLDKGAPSNLQTRLTGIYGSKATWLELFARVGAALSAQSGLTYVYEPNDDGAAFPDTSGQLGVRGDIRISGHELDGNSGVLAYNYSPNGGDMVIDTADNFYENRAGNDLGFRNVVTHEFGHGVGLGHTCPINETKLMEPTVTGAFDGPQLDDIRGLQRFYGDGIEDNDSITTGTELGTVQNGTIDPAPGRMLSIDDGADIDFFNLNLTANKSIGITLAPTGQTYLEGPQNEDSSCSAGTPLNPKVISNLGFELLKANSSGDFVSVATRDAAPIGGTETLPLTNFAQGGQFRIRVFGDATVKDVQTYSLELTVSGPVTQPTAGPTPTPAPPSPTPRPQPTAIRPIIDLNGLNADEAQGEDSANPSGIDATAVYNYKTPGILPDGKPGLVNGGPQLITPSREIIISDISSDPVTPGSKIAEARVELTPDVSCGSGSEIDPGGIAPDNCNPQGKRDNEVLGVNADRLKGVNDNLRQNISASYDVPTQILTLRGGVRSNDEIRNAYQQALKTVTYENKLPITDPNQPFNREPQLDDRIITYVVDTDNDSSNNQDSRFGFVDGPNSNPKQSKPAVLTLSFRERQSLIVTTTQDGDFGTDQFGRTVPASRDNETSLREAIEFANTIPFSNPDPDPNKPPIPTPPSIITFADDVRGSITLESPLPPINNRPKPLTIQGPGARDLTIDGSGAGGGIFQVNTSATISGLTISGGTAQVGPNRFSNSGGGIYAAPGSVLSVDACAISGNTGQVGGGIANIGGTLTLTKSTISGNNGGGLYLDNRRNGGIGTSNISNSTISGNSGNGITQASGDSDVRSSTITNNAPAGVAASGGRINFGNTIISGNASDNDVTSTGGTFTTSGYNILGSGNAVQTFSSATNDNRNNVGNSAGLSALGNNGGPTDTHALFQGSPAIDKGDPAITNPPVTDPPTPDPTDQRGTGFPRVVNGRIDVGAYEKQDNTPIVNPVISPRNPKTNDTITVNPNSDTTNLRYQFFVNGREITQNSRRNFLDLSIPGNGDRGDTIRVVVTAIDTGGISTGEDSVVVIDSLPTFSVRITATNPAPNQNSNEVLTNSKLTAVTTFDDPDGDFAFFTYQWKVNGQIRVQDRDRTIDLSRPGSGDRDDIVSVDVNAIDARTGQNVGTQSASVLVGNTAPIAQQVRFDVNAGETVRILLQATDVDTRQPTQTNPTGVDTRFRFTLRTQPTKGRAVIQTNRDGRDVLVYTANADAKGFDSILFTAADTARFEDGRLKLGQNYKNSERALARATIAPRASSPARSGLSAPQTSNPSAGSS